MSALAAEVVLERGMSRFILFYLTFVVWKPTNACTFFGLVHDFGTAWFQAADGKPTHIGLWIWTYWFRFPFPKDWFQFADGYLRLDFSTLVAPTAFLDLLII